MEDDSFPPPLKVGIAYNVKKGVKSDAEGTNGRGREVQVPAILSFLGIPFAGSDETTLGLALDKAMTKRYLSSFGVKTPAYQLIKAPDLSPVSRYRNL